MSGWHGDDVVGTAVSIGPADSRVIDTRWMPSSVLIERVAGWRRAASMARLLSWLSLGWMTGEGALGLVAGVDAGSVSLVGWALGSVIEGLASVTVIWRFTGSRTLSATAETTARKAVAVSLFVRGSGCRCAWWPGPDRDPRLVVD